MSASFLLTLPVILAAQTLAPNTGNIKLDADIEMHAIIEQSGGGCWPGFNWHSTYGGCRRRSIEQQIEGRVCQQSGYAGQETRTNTRYNYTLQSTGHVASEPWTYGAWNLSDCIKPDKPPPEPPTIANSVLIASSPHDVSGLDEVRLRVMFHAPTQTFWCYWNGNVYSPGPHDMLANGFTDANRTAWCISQPDGSLHYGHSHAESFIVSAKRRNASRIDFSYVPERMLNDCWCHVGSNRPQFRGVTHIMTP